MDEFNPYAPPKTLEQDEQRLFELETEAWRDGKLLMVRKDAALPDRCIRCNEPADGFRFKRFLTWAHPAFLILLFFCGPLPFVLLYFLVSKRGRVTVGLCLVHRRQRKQAILRGWLVALTGFIAFGFMAVLPHNYIGIALIGGIVLILTGFFVGAFGSRVLVPAKIDRNFIWLSKVSPVYLATFPDVQQP